jgi:Cof subfamily protein (haloacid dehalogenase superfamily)
MPVGQEKQKLYVSDLDGTLLRPDATLSSRSRTILQDLLAKGLLFTVASARSSYTIREVIKGVPLKLPVIEINGAFVSEMDSSRHLIINDLDPALLHELYDRIRKHGLVPIIGTFDGERDRFYFDRPANSGMKKVIESRVNARDPRVSPVEDLRVALRDRVVTFTIIAMETDLKQLREEIARDFAGRLTTHCFRDIYSGFHWFQIQGINASKDRAIQQIIERFDLNGVELVVFGDNENDTPMFRIADRAVAVENATRSLQKAATDIIGSNKKDSVIDYIQQDFKTPSRPGQ